MITPREIASRLGLRKYPRSWRGACPNCAYPASFAVKTNNHGAANLFCSNGCTYDQLSDMLGKIMGGEIKEANGLLEKTAPNPAARIEKALRLWSSALPLTHDAAAPAVTYLASRHIDHVSCHPRLRFRADTRHPEGGSLAAMIALATDAQDKPTGVHRTYLTKDGAAKASVMPPKASLGVVWGSAVRLGEPAEGEALVIGEGIENSAAAGRLTGLCAWAALSAGNLARGLVLPPYVRRIIIAVDHDMPQVINGRTVRPGQDAAAEAERRWRREGRKVELAVPDKPGSDFADLLRERLNA